MPTWPTTRPATISELAAAAASSSSCAKGSNCSASSTSNSADVGLNLELAFIEYAHAATLIMEMIPAHRDSQFGRGREGVDGGAEGESYCAQNGQDVLYRFGQLKATTLVNRYERYAKSTWARADAVPVFMVAPQSHNTNPKPHQNSTTPVPRNARPADRRG